MQYYYILSATVTAITSPVRPTSMSVNYNTFHDSGRYGTRYKIHNGNMLKTKCEFILMNISH